MVATAKIQYYVTISMNRLSSFVGEKMPAHYTVESYQRTKPISCHYTVILDSEHYWPIVQKYISDQYYYTKYRDGKFIIRMAGPISESKAAQINTALATA